MVTIHHDLTATVHLPLREEPYPLGQMVMVRIDFAGAIPAGSPHESVLTIPVWVNGAGAERTADGIRYRGTAHLAANPKITVLP